MTIDINELLKLDVSRPELRSVGDLKNGVYNAIGGGHADWSRGVFGSALHARDMIPPWWSYDRDKFLRPWWKKEDHLAGALAAMQMRIGSIETRIQPLNPHINVHSEQAKRIYDDMMNGSEFGAGWDITLHKFLEDVFGQDNGGFMLILGAGALNKKLPLGSGKTFKHLDSQYCIRTGNPLYPVVYHDPNRNITHVIHESRIIDLPLQPSADATMNNVGFCAVSKVFNTTLRLFDIANYYREKIGSQPLRAFMVANGISPENFAQAIAASEQQLEAKGMTHFSQTVGIASLDQPLDLKLVELSGLPDGFDEEVITRLSLYTIALGFGVDSREIWTAAEEGATRADAVITHMKSRGKMIGHITTTLARQINNKFLRSHLKFSFDAQDDAQDQLHVDIKEKFSKAIAQDVQSGVVDPRTARMLMVERGFLSEAQFEEMELRDGRLPNGTSVGSLFFSTDESMKMLLDLGVDDPLNVEKNADDQMDERIRNAEILANTVIVNSNIESVSKRAKQALAALKLLRAHYGGLSVPTQPNNESFDLMTPSERKEQERQDEIMEQQKRENNNESRGTSSPDSRN